MFTVRFPSGIAIVYNDAQYLMATENTFRLYTKKEGRWIATIAMASGAMIEAQKPCRIYDARQTTEQLRSLLGSMRKLTSYSDAGVLAEMKRELEHFDARKRCWKD